MSRNRLVSFNFNPGYYDRNLYRTRLMGTSDCNVFIPVYALFAHDMLVFDGEGMEGIRVLEYSLPGLPSVHENQRQYARMNTHLRQGQRPMRYNFKLRGVDHFICMHKGLLYKEDDVLMCLGIDRDYVMETPIAEIAENLDTTKLTLFIANEFDNNDTYKNIRKKIGSMYIDECKSIGVDIVMTSRINNWLFKNNFKEPKFKNVMGMMKHLKEEVPMTLLTE